MLTCAGNHEKCSEPPEAASGGKHAMTSKCMRDGCCAILPDFGECIVKVDIHARIAGLEAENERMKAAITWVIKDAAYKPPEMIGDVAERWISRLREVMGKT
jgi:hypothetical protein